MYACAYYSPDSKQEAPVECQASRLYAKPYTCSLRARPLGSNQCCANAVPASVRRHMGPQAVYPILGRKA